MSEIGSWLIRAREARGLTLEDAERDTRISRRYLQALESEQFDVIPAPVYARGFLRSYSQYLGLDPQAVLALFPRDEEPSHAAATTPSARGPQGSQTQPQQPASAIGASRPTWKRPQTSRPATPRRPATDELPFEPTIGIDIGVPSPARRINTDPAAQARSFTVLVVAIGAVAFVILLAVVIAKLGGGDDTTGVPRVAASPGGATTQTAAAPTTAAGTSGLPITPGLVPDVEGKQLATARLAITEAGFAVSEKHQKDAKPKGTIIQQSPAANTDKSKGITTVTIVVSDGP